MMETASQFLFHFFFSFLAAASFAVLNNAPRRELWACGVAGAAGWVAYFCLTFFGAGVTSSVFFGAVVAAILSRLFSYSHRAPSTLYLIPGIIPLVPGSFIYYTMQSILENDSGAAFSNAVMTLKLSGVIAIGIIVIFTLPYRFFAVFTPKERKASPKRDWLYRKKTAPPNKRS